MFVYGVGPNITQTTSVTPGTELPKLFFTTGGTSRRMKVMGLYIHGKGAGLTAISGISFRIKRYTGADPTGGTSTTPNPRDPGAQVAQTNDCRYEGAAITDGTSPIMMLSIGCGAAGASGWFAANEQALIAHGQDANQDAVGVSVASGLASMNFEQFLEIVE